MAPTTAASNQLLVNTTTSLAGLAISKATSARKFNVDEWLKTLDIWDEKYDYVMHDSHWLTSNYDPKCEKCLATGKTQAPPLSPEILPELATLSSTVTKIPCRNITSSPRNVFASQFLSNRAPLAMAPMAPNYPTINNYRFQKEEKFYSTNTTITNGTITKSHLSNTATTTASATATTHSDISILSPPLVNRPIIPDMTPIPTKNTSTRAFVTPQTSKKFNDTFTRDIKQSNKKLLNQTNQELIDLNETFYKSALELSTSNPNK